MSDENELQSTAEEHVELNADDLASQEGASETPENEIETDEQKNARVQEEDAERARVKEDRRQSKVQARMNELTAQRYAEQRRADDLAEQNRRLLEAIEGRRNPTLTNGTPQREQFDSYEDFLEAKAEYKAEQIVKQQIEQFTESQKKSSSIAQMQQSQKDSERLFLERRQVAEKELPDYKDVVEDWEPNLPNNVVDMIIKLEQGPLISYHMAKNPSLEAQFRDSSPEMHGVLLGQLIASLKSPQKVSSAPTPGKPVSSSKAASGTQPPSDPNQYFAWAQKNLR